MNNRISIPIALYEKMAKVWSLYEMGILVVATTGSPIKLPPRDPNLPPARVADPDPVGTPGASPEKLPDAPTIPAVGLSSEFRPVAGTYAESEFRAANPDLKKGATHDRPRDSPQE